MYVINEEQNNIESANQLVAMLYEIEDALFGAYHAPAEVAEKQPEPAPGMFGTLMAKQNEMRMILSNGHRITQRLREKLHIVEPSPKAPAQYDTRPFADMPNDLPRKW